MSVLWSGRFNPTPIVDRLQESRTVDGAGKPAFEGFAYSECVALLQHMLVFPEEVPETEARGLVNRATMALRDGPPLTAQRILSSVNKLTSHYLEAPTHHFVLVTGISIAQSAELPGFSQRSVKVEFPRHLRRGILLEREQLHRAAREALLAEPPKGYLPLLARVSARSPYEAAETALDTIDLRRGIWNWYFNRRHSTRMSFGSQDPVNRLILGPFHTLHTPSGKLATDTFWFEPSYRAPVKNVDLQGDLDNLLKFTGMVRSALRRSKYPRELEKSIVAYTRALDERDLQAGFLRLWGVLEALTFTTKEEPHVSIAKRASFIFADRDYFGQVMAVLTDHRNRAVHANASTRNIETYLYQLKNGVEALLEFHLWNRFRFQSVEHACQFLSLPSDQEALVARAKISKHALEYTGYKPRRRKAPKGAA